MQKEKARALLQQMLGPNAEFRDGQWEAIDLVANQGRRVLVVQRTGWGKSLVYFLAARVLRDAGAGPALLISPLLSLMRNQILAAEKLGIRAATVHSENLEEWKQVEAALQANQVDVLMVSPERLGNADFLHRDVHPTGAMMQEIRDKMMAYAAMIKTNDSTNPILKAKTELTMNYARAWAALHGEPVQFFQEVRDYQAGSWDRPRRVISKCEVTAQGGPNQRFVITNLTERAAEIYQQTYVKRGDTPERAIQELKHGLGIDRLSFGL